MIKYTALLMALACAPMTTSHAQQNFYLDGKGEFMEFTFPIDCEIGVTCFAQQYVDVDESRRYRDHNCRGLTSNNHKGTDIRIPDIKTMEKGVSVYAMADGTIKGLRDGQEDGLVYRGEAEIQPGNECGNALIIDHGNNWKTHYCHLKEGSIKIIRNQKVRQGQKIAEVGMSGAASYPQLHFEVRNAENTVDPYTGALASEGCKVESSPLWRTEVLNQAIYYASGTLNRGFTDQVPTAAGVEEGRYPESRPTLNSDRLSFYVRFFGLKTDDIQEMTLTGPDGTELATFNRKHEDLPKREHMEYLSIPRPEGGWSKGPYVADYSLIRYSQTMISEHQVIDIPKKAPQPDEAEAPKARNPLVKIPEAPAMPSFN
jgi:hypothetical protein